MSLALAALSVLIIGDSHLAASNYLITTLHDDMLKRGNVVHTIGVCGSNATDWTKSVAGSCGGAERVGDGKISVHSQATTTPVTDLVKKDKADLVIVVLGDTMAAYTNPNFPKTWAWQQVTSLTRAISATGAKCAWVGPGWGSEGGKYGKTFKRAQVMSDFLAANVAPCTYVDSLKMSKQGQWATIDGQHLTNSGYAQWGPAIGKAIADSPALKK